MHFLTKINNSWYGLHKNMNGIIFRRANITMYMYVHICITTASPSITRDPIFLSQPSLFRKLSNIKSGYFMNWMNVIITPASHFCSVTISTSKRKLTFRRAANTWSIILPPAASNNEQFRLAEGRRSPQDL